MYYLDCETHLTVQVNCIDLNAKDGLGLTPFMKVCSNGNKEVGQIIVRSFWRKKPIDLNAKDIHGRTPLTQCSKSSFFVQKINLDISSL